MKHALSILILAMLPTFAMSATPCGVGGTAKVASGATVTRTAAEAKNLQIKDDGYWWTCSSNAVKAPDPKPCVPNSQGFREWTQGKYKCTTYDKYATSANSPARDSVILDGNSKMWRQWQGSMRGALIEKCTDGVRSQVTAFCAPATHCDVQYTFTNDGGKTTYTYDARARDKQVPVGSTVNAVSSSGKTVPIKCVAGSFQKN